MWRRVILCLSILMLLPLVYLLLQKRGYSIKTNYFVWVIVLLLVLAILWWPKLRREVEEKPVREE
jgi:hypothetical protein